MKWVWIILALAYLLSPYDIIPGFSAFGWIDDVIVLVLLYRYLAKFNRMRNIKNRPHGERPQPGRRQTADHATRRNERAQTPHEILGVSPTATREEIKSAYRRLVAKYHPDKVAHLGDEFQTLAEQRFKEIQDAYQKLVQ